MAVPAAGSAGEHSWDGSYQRPAEHVKQTAGGAAEDAARGATVVAVAAEHKPLAVEGAAPGTELEGAVRRVVVEHSCKPEVPEVPAASAGAGSHFGRFRHPGLGRYGRRAKVDHMLDLGHTEQRGNLSQGC